MSKYVLGENAARKLRALFNGKMQAGRIDGTSGGIVDDADFLPPFTVQWAASLASGEGESATDGEWIIWLPHEEILNVDGDFVDVRGELEDVGGDYPEGWYVLSGFGQEGGTVYLNIITKTEDDPEGGSDSGTEEEEEEPSVSAEFSNEKKEPEEGESVLSILVAETSRGSGGAVSVKQVVSSAVFVGGSCSVDERSVDKLNNLELRHFKDGENDGTKGFLKRIKADTETGELTSDDDSLKIVCKQNNQIVYIPLMGDGEDPEPPEGEEDQRKKSDECDHPGSNGSGSGVDPTDYGTGSGGGGAGGVSPSDTTVHPGDKKCNECV